MTVRTPPRSSAGERLPDFHRSARQASVVWRLARKVSNFGSGSDPPVHLFLEHLPYLIDVIPHAADEPQDAQEDYGTQDIEDRSKDGEIPDKITGRLHLESPQNMVSLIVRRHPAHYSCM